MKYTVNIIIGVIIIYLFAVLARGIYNKKKAFINKIAPAPSIILDKVTPTPTLPVTPGSPAPGKRYFVSSGGNDGNNGLSDKKPFKTIQKAVDLAVAGDTVYLLPGEYMQDIVSKNNGSQGQSITISGTKESVVKGGGNTNIVEINNSYIKLDGFTIDGLFKQPREKLSFRDKLVYVISTVPGVGVTGFNMTNMDVKNSRSECVRLRYFTQNSEISHNSISGCGRGDFEFNNGGKNGEGIYVGTAPEQRTNGKNPTSDIDHSNNNWIHHNDINTQGNECVDVKEGSSFNIVEYNNCTGQKDPNSGGFDSRGNNNIFRLNTVFDNLGVGVRLGGDTAYDGIDNEVYNNVIINNKEGGIKFEQAPQGKVCGNSLNGNGKANSVGSFTAQFDPGSPCN